MTPALRLLAAEMLKLRRTLALWMVVLAPSVVVLLQFLLFHERVNYYARQGGPLWDGYVRNCVVLWAALMLPLYVSLQTSLLASVEHNEERWRNLLALPSPRWLLYLVKQAIPLLMVAVSTLVLTFGAVASGVLLRTLQPELRFPDPVPWSQAWHYGWLAFCGALLLVAIQQWIALRFAVFAVGAGVGIAASIAGMLLMQSEKYGPWWPWSLAVQVVSARSGAVEHVLIYSLSGALAVTLLATWEFARREFR